MRWSVHGECRGKKRAGQSGEKRKCVRGKREGAWPLRRTRVLPFCQGLPYARQQKVPGRGGHVAGGLEPGGLAALDGRRQ